VPAGCFGRLRRPE